MARLRQEAHDLGVVFDQEAADSAAEFKDNITRLNTAVNGLKFTLARELMPVLSAGIPILTEWAKAIGPIIENTLNWHAAHDRQIKQQDAWRNMMLERQRMMGGLTHELGEALDILEFTLESQGLLNEQAINTIDILRAQVKAQEEVGEILKENTIDNDAWADSLGRAREQLGRYVDELERFREKQKFTRLSGMITSMNQIIAAGGTPSQQRISDYYNLMSGNVPIPRKWAKGGVIDEPTLMTSLRTMQPYAIAGEAGREFVTPEGGRGGKVNIYVELDGRVIAQAIGQPLVEEIRLRTGVRI